MCVFLLRLINLKKANVIANEAARVSQQKPKTKATSYLLYFVINKISTSEKIKFANCEWHFFQCFDLKEEKNSTGNHLPSTALVRVARVCEK